RGTIYDLTGHLAQYTVPVWSPDGSHMAFAAGSQQESDIFVMDSNGANLRNLTHDQARDNSPEWSPDGSQIVFTSNDNVVMANVNGDGSHSPDTYGKAFSPAWSPDGKQLVYIMHYSVSTDVVMVTSEETASLDVNGRGCLASIPIWSPDGQ